MSRTTHAPIGAPLHTVMAAAAALVGIRQDDNEPTIGSYGQAADAIALATSLVARVRALGPLPRAVEHSVLSLEWSLDALRQAVRRQNARAGADADVAPGERERPAPTVAQHLQALFEAARRHLLQLSQLAGSNAEREARSGHADESGYDDEMTLQ